MTPTDAINVFIEQSLNIGGLPFVVVQDNKQDRREKAIARLRAELQLARDSVRSDDDWVSEEAMRKRFGLTQGQ